MAKIDSSITLKELRQKARDLNIKKWYSLKKKDLLKAVDDYKITTPEVEEESKPETISEFIAKDVEEFTSSRSRTTSWIVLIVLVITVPLLAWWISQPDPWFQQFLNFFKF